MEQPRARKIEASRRRRVARLDKRRIENCSTGLNDITKNQYNPAQTTGVAALALLQTCTALTSSETPAPLAETLPHPLYS